MSSWHKYPISPGEILLEEIQARGWTDSKLAKKMKRPVLEVEHLLEGKIPITKDLADCLSKVFSTSAQFWLNLEFYYQRSKKGNT